MYGFWFLKALTFFRVLLLLLWPLCLTGTTLLFEIHIFFFAARSVHLWPNAFDITRCNDKKEEINKSDMYGRQQQRNAISFFFIVFFYSEDKWKSGCFLFMANISIFFFWNNLFENFPYFLCEKSANRWKTIQIDWILSNCWIKRFESQTNHRWRSLFYN